MSSGLDELLRENGSPLPLLPDKVFGITVPLTELKGMLTRHQVVGVYGIGGCGKTTLANVLCRDKHIQAEYGKPIFLTISSPGFGTQWQTLLKKIDNGVRASPNEDQRKVLIVLDDVPSVNKDIWLLVGTIKKAEHVKVLITSRIQLDVCESSYSVNRLGDNEARELFEHHALRGSETSWKPDDQLIDKIVRGCKFHPLALEVIGRSLATSDRRMWQNAAERLAQTGGIFEGRDDEIFRCLSTSFISLTKEGRDCFLDFGSFPEGQTIPAAVIIAIWSETHGLTENEAYEVLVELGRRNLVKLIDRKCGDAGDPDKGFSSVSVTQHDLLRELAVYEIRKENERQITRLIMEKRERNEPENWVRTSKAKLVSINTGDMNRSDWPDLNLPDAEVLILNFSAASYCLPRFLQSMKNLKVLVVANHGSDRAELSGLNLLSSLNKLKRVLLRKVVLPDEPLRVVEGGLTAITVGADPREMQKVSLVLCDVRHMLQTLSLFPIIKELEVDYCTELNQFPDTIYDISDLEKLSITNCPDLQTLPDDISKLHKLEVLRLHACGNLECLPHSLSKLSQLRYLDISDCHSLEAFPEQHGKLSCLERIDMRSCSNMKQLDPSAVKQMKRLKEVVCDDEEVASLWTSCGLDRKKIVVRKMQATLDFLR